MVYTSAKRRVVLLGGLSAFLWLGGLPAGSSSASGAGASYAVPFDEAAFDAAMAAGGPVLVEVTAPWCPTCRAQHAVLSDLLITERFAGYTVFAVDFDSRKDLLRRFDARRQSTLIVFAGGEEVRRTVGDATRDGIVALLSAAL